MKPYPPDAVVRLQATDEDAAASAPADPDLPRSKVLVLEHDAAAAQTLKAYCEARQLLPMKVPPDHLLAVLDSSVDLGALFLSDQYDCDGLQGIALACLLHRSRPELPIFLRRTSNEPLPKDDEGALSQAYTLAELGRLDGLIERALFSRVYPPSLVRGISEITRRALEGLLLGVQVHSEAPVIARDRLIHGEVYSLMPLEAHWCRGYLMLQIRQGDLQRLDAYVRRCCGDAGTAPSIRSINQVFGEATNLIWGAFKNRYVCYDVPQASYLTQVPIVINHLQRYISFGSEDPQLCFRYLLTIPDESLPPLELYQRLIFNLNWSPEQFYESAADAQAGGELEMF